MTPEITQRVPQMLGMESGELGTAGLGSPGANVRVVVVSIWNYILVDVLLFSYVMGWIATGAFYGAGDLEQHGFTHQSSALSILTYISVKALIPGSILAMKDLSVWLMRRRQAHGIT